MINLAFDYEYNFIIFILYLIFRLFKLCKKKLTVIANLKVYYNRL